MTRPPVAIVHDYLTQRGGAERVVLALARALPGAPVYTSLYDPAGTFPEFGHMDVRTSALDRLTVVRKHHRAALPLLAPAMGSLRVDAEVAVCSSSGWAHGAPVSGSKLVYCHAPARWLYQTRRYLSGMPPAARPALAALAPALRRWDRRAAIGADRYLANSSAVAAQVRAIYGIEAEVVPPPVTVDVFGERRPVAGLDGGFFLCVSRLLAYKNVDAVVDAFSRLRGERLVVVGDGPMRNQLAAAAPPNVTFLGQVDDAQLRWLYRSSRALVSASYEDFGLTPVEAAAFGRPSAVLRWGGFLDTLVEGETGVYIERPDGPGVAEAVGLLLESDWAPDRLRAHADRYAQVHFARRIQAELAELGLPGALPCASDPALVAGTADVMDPSRDQAPAPVHLARTGRRRSAGAGGVPSARAMMGSGRRT